MVGWARGSHPQPRNARKRWCRMRRRRPTTATSELSHLPANAKNYKELQLKRIEPSLRHPTSAAAPKQGSQRPPGRSPPGLLPGLPGGSQARGQRDRTGRAGASPWAAAGRRAQLHRGTSGTSSRPGRTRRALLICRHRPGPPSGEGRDRREGERPPPMGAGRVTRPRPPRRAQPMRRRGALPPRARGGPALPQCSGVGGAPSRPASGVRSPWQRPAPTRRHYDVTVTSRRASYEWRGTAWDTLPNATRDVTARQGGRSPATRSSYPPPK